MASPLPVARLQLEETLNGGGGISGGGGSPMSQRSQLFGNAMLKSYLSVCKIQSPSINPLSRWPN